MHEKLMKYLDGVFAPYEDSKVVTELKEELYANLLAKLNDYKNQGHDDETAYQMAIDSIGDIQEIIESISVKTKELQQMLRNDLSKSNLKDSDLKEIAVQDGKFDMSDLRGSDFSNSDLVKASFKCSDLRNVRFDEANLTGAIFNMSDMRNVSFDSADLTGAKIKMCDLKDVTIKNCIFNNTDFNSSDLSGLCFDNLTLNGTVFEKTALVGTSFRNAVLRNVSFRHVPKKGILRAVFDGASMDKLTYAILKGINADLTNVTVI